MFSDFDAQTRQMLTGNLLMIGCCAFYLAWWLIAFKPEGAVKGIRSGWLLIPALIFGVAAVMQIAQGRDILTIPSRIFMEAKSCRHQKQRCR
ncbi:MAG: hypothetical protein LUF35_05565 [Lachnospiraceae bacterium]|nr:hypothetical protein [Lachnospiraceae bacterium]